MLPRKAKDLRLCPPRLAIPTRLVKLFLRRHCADGRQLSATLVKKESSILELWTHRSLHWVVTTRADLLEGSRGQERHSIRGFERCTSEGTDFW